MASASASASVLILLIFVISASSPLNTSAADSTGDDPTPTPWPHQFHATLLMNKSSSLQLIDLWYDWPNGRNFNIIRDQLDTSLFYDLEWNNGTSFFYRLDSSRECRSVQLEVGILRPNWLDAATYLGQRHADGFLCNVWTKAEFLVYYEDVATKRPVLWIFYTGREAHVMSFEEGAALEDAKWQVPAHCFEKEVSAEIPNMKFDGTSINQESLLHRALRGSISMSM